MVMEIIRRSFWGVLRLENEQLRNTQGFRRVDVIPLSFSTEGQHEYQDTKRLNNMKVCMCVGEEVDRSSAASYPPNFSLYIGGIGGLLSRRTGDLSFHRSCSGCRWY